MIFQCSARHLQLGDHTGFCIVRRRHVLNQSLGQHLAVELLKHVFVLDVLEDDHLWSQQIKHLAVVMGFCERVHRFRMSRGRQSKGDQLDQFPGNVCKCQFVCVLRVWSMTFIVQLSLDFFRLILSTPIVKQHLGYWCQHLRYWCQYLRYSCQHLRYWYHTHSRKVHWPLSQEQVGGSQKHKIQWVIFHGWQSLRSCLKWFYTFRVADRMGIWPLKTSCKTFSFGLSWSKFGKVRDKLKAAVVTPG